MKKILNLISRWCKECSRLYTLYKDPKLSSRVKDFKVEFYDVDEYPHLLNRFNFGGIPSIVFIDDDKLLYGFPGTPTTDYMIKLLDRINYYEPIEISKLGEEDPDKRDLSNEDLTRILNSIMKNVDWMFGGFQEEYKFPHFDENLFMLKMYLRKGVKGYLKMVKYNLDKMLLGGIWDGEVGGISRMTLSNDWSHPDKAYLIEVNTQALKTIYYLYMLLGKDKKYLKYIEKLSHLISKKLYKNRFLRGIYLNRDRFELDDRVIPHILFQVLRDILEITKYGEFKKLRAKAIRNLNYEIDKKYETLYTYARMMDSYIEAYCNSGEEEYLEIAVKIYKYIRDKFKDKSGAYRDTIELDYSIIIRRPFKINSELAYSLLKLYHLTEEEEYRTDAYDILKYYSNLYVKHGFDTGVYGIALDTYLNGIAVLEISGFNKVPKNIIKVLKPFVLYKWIGEERSIEYIDGDIRIKLV